MSMLSYEKITKACHVLSAEANALYLGTHVEEIDYIPDPLTFYRNYVSKNVPVLIKNGIRHWPAIGKWCIPYFRNILNNKLIDIAVTPSGYADAIAKREMDDDNDGEYFVLPDERRLNMTEFLNTLENPESNSILYIQKQNSNFTEDFQELWEDVEIDFPWAMKIFGKRPDAINFWMGDKRAITSMHKDPYENMYCVMSGKKYFILHPPTDLPWIPYGKYPRAMYKEINPGNWIIEPIRSSVVSAGVSNNSVNIPKRSETFDLIPWISVDPLNPNYERYPQYRDATRLVVTVEEGDLLYLPSLWFHHVSQSHACIAMNYWFDMEIDIKYAYYKALESLCQ